MDNNDMFFLGHHALIPKLNLWDDICEMFATCEGV